MNSYFVRRLAQALVVLVGVTILVFLSVRLIPGDPATVLAGPNATFEDIEVLREKYGLSGSIVQQYFAYMGGILHFDLGLSLRSGQPVAEELLSKIPYTAILAVCGVGLSVLIGVPAGIIAGARRGTALDRIITASATTSICVPVFLIALLMQYYFGAVLSWFPTSGVGDWRNYVLPSIAVSMFSIATIAKMTRTGVAEALGEDFVRTLRASGVSEVRIKYIHAFRSASLPVITMVGLALGRNLTGTIVTETVFAIPGVGRYLVNAIGNRDYVVVQGVTLFIAVVFLIVNFTTDLVYKYADPRVSAA